jgi:hypothetical protein
MPMRLALPGAKTRYLHDSPKTRQRKRLVREVFLQA